MVTDRMPQIDSPEDPYNMDGTAVTFRWTRISEDKDPDISDLPSFDYSLYLFNAVKFYLGQLFNIIDEESFMQSLNEFYEDAATKSRLSRTWYCQYLLVLAFGKAFVVTPETPSSPAGSKYAARAMGMLPDLTDIRDEPLLAIEVLCLAALYFESIDMRVAAYQHIGQALRICFIEGIHREVSEGAVGSKVSQRCSTVWWTVYILDREFSALLGAPSSVREEDITTALPSERDNSLRAAATTLQIQLARLTSRILTSVYQATCFLEIIS
ncbi:hypothetical protein BP5796_07546 [Coleophoma crateriformis]|uniref:Xylanolytic transcriptional activator regulatory domain-containing protein n=1 Tax=Coleophoma crateriformis TaxID=565419 RepID=A0A3D8RJN2_9HELO|nr:hypothetical protein BP5796_07546 [Coleophoma crateriformis]